MLEDNFQYSRDGEAMSIDQFGDNSTTVAYPSDGVTITCPAPAFLTVAPPRFPGYEGDNFVFAGTRYHCDRGCYTPDGAADMTISFAAARGVESISLVGRLNTCICPAEGGAYKEGTMTVHLANGQTVTTDLVLSASVVPGNYGPFWTGSQYDVSFGQTLWLTQYGPLTEIDLHPNRIAFCNAEDTTGVSWDHDWIGGQEFCVDDIQFVSYEPALLDLTVTDHANPTNHVTAITAAAIKDLYLPADADGVGHVDLTAMFSPLTFGGTGEGQYVHLMVKRGTTTIGSDYTFTNANTDADLALETTPTAHDFSLVLWLDLDHDGYYETGEPTREVDVHIPTLSLEIDANHDGTINSTDDALEEQGPATIDDEGDSGRTAIQLAATCGGPANDLSVKVRNICGMEFWDAATGGNQLQVDGSGNIVDDSMPTFGQYSRTLWVSVDSTKPADFTQITAILDPPPWIILATAIVGAAPRRRNPWPIG